jgi:dolichyl-phosphate beta-glucosyltransferase
MVEYNNDGIIIIIPAYNEANRISLTISSIIEHKDELNIKELIIVDDASTDGMIEVIQHYVTKMPIRIIRYELNKGKWGAIHEGLKVVNKGWILLMDADGSAGVEQLKRIPGWMNDEWKNRDVVFAGSRFLSKSVVEGKSIMRSFVSQVYRAYARGLYKFGTKHSSPHDLQCPFKLFKREWLIGKEDRLLVNRFAGDIELLMVMDKTVVSFPIFFEHCAGSHIRSSTVQEMLIETWQVANRERKVKR